ncbi:MAG: murein biosynthesis integral membrane protein MurJ [Chlamydiota bacterium]
MAMTSDTIKTIQRSAAGFFSGTMLSRISGMARDIAMAAAFGSVPAVAAFMMAFRFANLLRRLLGEGAMQSAFIPHFENKRIQCSALSAAFFRDIAASLSLLLIVMVIVAEFALWGSMALLTLSPGNHQVLLLTALMLPGTIFICLYGLNTGLLQCEGRYFVPSVAPVAFNLIWVGAVLWLQGDPPQSAMVALSVIVVVAFIAQWAITLPGVIKSLKHNLVLSLCRGIKLFSKDIRIMGKALLLGIIGVSATQLNSALDSIFARAADSQGPAYLWYAMRIDQLPLALFGIAISGALLPPLSRAIKSGNHLRYCQFFEFGMNRTITLMIPCTLALIVMGHSVVNLLYGHGNFAALAAVETSLCLWAYGLGLLPMTMVLLLSGASYALEDYKTPTIITIVAVLLNILLNAFFVFYLGLGAVSIALATACSALCNAYLLYHMMQRRLVLPSFGGVGKHFFKVSIASIIAALIVVGIDSLLPFQCAFWMIIDGEGQLLSRQISWQILNLGVEVAVFGTVLMVVARILGIQEFFDLLKR